MHPPPWQLFHVILISTHVTTFLISSFTICSMSCFCLCVDGKYLLSYRNGGSGSAATTSRINYNVWDTVSVLTRQVHDRSAMETNEARPAIFMIMAWPHSGKYEQEHVQLMVRPFSQRNMVVACKDSHPKRDQCFLFPYMYAYMTMRKAVEHPQNWTFCNVCRIFVVSAQFSVLYI